MTYLELVQALWRETGTGGPKPATVVNQSGESERLVFWIQRADLDVQQAHIDWNFRWVGGQALPTVASQQLYTLPADLDTIDEDTMFIGEEPLMVHDYLDVKREYQDATRTGKPHRAVRLPSGQLRLDDTPDDVYNITYDYFKMPTRMEVDDVTESVIPNPYRDVIVARALLLYANYENAPELKPQANELYSLTMPALEATQLPGRREAHRQAEGNDLRMKVE